MKTREDQPSFKQKTENKIDNKVDNCKDSGLRNELKINNKGKKKDQ